jgi:hypothetical protein
MPRALELVQFLSIYCKALPSRQQTRVSDFQVASFTHIAWSKAEYCGVCPGFCAQPLVLLFPTFALLSCLFALGVLVAALDAYSLRAKTRPPDEKLQCFGRQHAAHHQLRAAAAQRRQGREAAVAKVLLDAEAS